MRQDAAGRGKRMAKKTTSQTTSWKRALWAAYDCDEVAEMLFKIVTSMKFPYAYWGGIPVAMMMKFMERQGAEMPLEVMKNYRRMVILCLDDQLKKLEKLDKQRKAK